MLKEVGEDVTSELRWSPHNEGRDPVIAPRDNVVGRGVVN